MSRKARNSLVMDNFRLRKANIELAAGEQKVIFQAALGECCSCSVPGLER